MLYLYFLQLPPLPSHHGGTSSNAVNGVQDKGRPTFGVDLAEQMNRDNVEVPAIVKKCCDAIERYGIQTQGIYRISGTTSKVANLRQRLDKGLSISYMERVVSYSRVYNSSDLEAVDLDAPEWSGDIHNVTSVLKMWLRELPDPLLTYNLHQGFMEAASSCYLSSQASLPLKMFVQKSRTIACDIYGYTNVLTNYLILIMQRSNSS
jgi:Rho GTPase-activating protein RGD1